MIAKHGRLDVRPLRCVSRDGHEVLPQEHAGDAVDGENARGERRDIGLLGRAEIARLSRQHIAPGQELQGRGIGRLFGLDEHFSLLDPRFKAAAALWNSSKQENGLPCEPRQAWFP